MNIQGQSKSFNKIEVINTKDISSDIGYLLKWSQDK